MGAEVYSFADSFDKEFIVRKDLENMLCCELSLHIYTDSKQLLYAMMKVKHTTEKRLMIDVSTAREVYRSYEITQVGLLSMHHDPADGMFKVNDNGALRDQIVSVNENFPVEQWIVRS